MKILVTGTHFTPALATIEELRSYKIDIIYVGRKTTLEGDPTPSIESKILPNLRIKFIPISTGRLQRKLTIYTLSSLLKIPIGLIQAFHIVLKEKPDVVLSFGGYVGLPVVTVAWLFSIPIIIHEQTIVSGLSNKVGGYLADKIAISFPQNKFFNREKVILTGNPLRREIIEISRDVKLRHPKGGLSSKVKVMPRVLIVGGNQGSHVINKAVESCLDKLTKIAKVTHQTGDSKFNDFDRLKQKQNEYYQVEKFIDEGWGKILREADLVVSRAGINTLMELAFLGKPTLLIPIEAHPEQEGNAKYFASLGLTKILPQSKLTGKTLLENIKEMLSNLTIFKRKAMMAKEVIIPGAAKRLALETVLLGKND